MLYMSTNEKLKHDIINMIFSKNMYNVNHVIIYMNLDDDMNQLSVYVC